MESGNVVGSHEEKNKEITMNDFYTLNLNKMDTFVCLKPSDVVAWKGEDSENDDDEEDEEEDEEEESEEDNEDSGSSSDEEEETKEESTSKSKKKVKGKGYLEVQ